MKMKTQLTLAAVVAAGLMASGCSQQMVAQQAAEAAPAVKTVVDCSTCGKPKPQAGGNKYTHTHPAIPKCTKSIKHTHKFNNRNHSHKYGCKKAAPKRVAPKKMAPKKVAPVKRDPNAHTHPAIPNCTNSIKHSHPSGNRAHSHRYSCRKAAPQQRQQRRQSGHVHPAIPGCTNSIRHNHKSGNRPHNHRYSCRRGGGAQQPPRQQVVPVMPKVKAKGTYRGPIKIDSVMQQYQN